MPAVAAQSPTHAEHFALAQQTLGFVTWIWNGSGDRAHWLGDLSPLLGLPAGSFSGSYEDYQWALHPDDIQASRRTLKECIKGIRPEYRTEERVIWPDGSVHWLETYGRATYGADGRATSLVGVVRDVTDRKRLEEARRKSEEKFAKAFQACPDYMVISRIADGCFLDVNPEFTRVTGYSAGEVIGHNGEEIGIWKRPADLALFRETLRAKGEVRDMVAEFACKNGEVVQCKLASAVTEMNGEAVAITIARDLTGLERAQQHSWQSERKFRAVFETSPEPVSITRLRDSRILELNEACAQLIGLPRELLIGSPTADLAAYANPSDRDRVMKMLAEEGEVGNHMTQRVRPDGTLMDLLESCKTIELEGETCVVWSWRDVTAIRQVERTLEELNASLECRVRDRTAELEAANRELDSFSHSVSHDLRAPLFQIGGFATLLRKDRDSSLSAEALRFLERIENGADQMGQLLEGLLEFSVAGRAAIRRGPVDMQALVGEVLMMLRGPESARAEIRVDHLPQVRGDPRLLRQVWQNLLSNALKFSRHAQAPKIEVGAERRDGIVEFLVCDNGAGFDMQQAGKLFGVFERLHTAEEFEGTGAGLSIVKRIIERHGGRITASSEPGRGACLRFTLPE
jgi:PAS domain S-box-containing protein